MKEEANQHEAVEKQRGLGESKIYKGKNNARINQNNNKKGSAVTGLATVVTLSKTG